MSADREIGHLLTDLGFCGESARAAARAVLVEAGLFNPKTTRVSDEKLPRIEALLTERFRRSSTRATPATTPMTWRDPDA
jgi:hypothetical protein